MASRNICVPCSTEDKNVPAFRWCIDCQEFMCKGCTKSHRKFKALLSHRLINLADLELKPSYGKSGALGASFANVEDVTSDDEISESQQPSLTKRRTGETGGQRERVKSVPEDEPFDSEGSSQAHHQTGLIGRRRTQASNESPDIGKPWLQHFGLTGSIKGSLQETISDIAVDTDGRIFLCSEFRCFCVHVYDEYYHLIKSVEMENRNPCRITILPNSSKQALVVFGSYIIQFLNLKSLLVGDVIEFDFRVTGITSSANNIYLGSKGKIYILDMKCQVCNTIPTLNSLEFVQFIHLGIGDRIYYTDYKVYHCITYKGQRVLHLSIPDEGSHRNMIADSQGYLYVVGMQSATIARFHPDGVLDSIILDKKDDIKYPLAACFNKARDNLFVSKKEESVKVFKCS